MTASPIATQETAATKLIDDALGTHDMRREWKDRLAAAIAEALSSAERRNEELVRERDEATKPLKDTVNRILDEHSAWIAQPNPEVASRIAFAAAVAVSVQFETRPDPELYVPGEFRCAKCGFTLSQFRMRAGDGAIGSRDEPGERCPNDDAPLWRVTWKQRANDHYERAAAEMERAAKAESALASLTGQVGEMRDALKPFVQHYKSWMDDYPDSHESSTFSRHTFGQLRAARSAVATTPATTLDGAERR